MSEVKLREGKVSEFENASKKNIAIDITKKRFDGATLRNIEIHNDSMISMCSFVKTNFQVCEFENVNFVKCDFKEADMFSTSFKSCEFNECSFDEVKFNNVTFDEKCKINLCTFNGVDTTSLDGVKGIEPKNFKIITEMGAPAIPALNELGFSESLNGSEYKLSEMNSKEEFGCKDCVSIFVSWDPELMNGMYRALVYAGDSCIFTWDLPNLSELSVHEVSIMLTAGMKSALKRLQNEIQKENLTKLIEKITI